MRKLQATSCTLMLLLVAIGWMAMAAAAAVVKRSELPYFIDDVSDNLSELGDANSSLDLSSEFGDVTHGIGIEDANSSLEAPVDRVKRVADGGANGDLCSPATRNGMVCCRWASGGGGGCKVKRNVRMRVACAGRPDRIRC